MAVMAKPYETQNSCDESDDGEAMVCREYIEGVRKRNSSKLMQVRDTKSC